MMRQARLAATVLAGALVIGAGAPAPKVPISWRMTVKIARMQAGAKADIALKKAQNDYIEALAGVAGTAAKEMAFAKAHEVAALVATMDGKRADRMTKIITRAEGRPIAGVWKVRAGDRLLAVSILNNDNRWVLVAGKGARNGKVNQRAWRALPSGEYLIRGWTVLLSADGRSFKGTAGAKADTPVKGILVRRHKRP
jgi:hypothetical protein